MSKFGMVAPLLVAGAVLSIVLTAVSGVLWFLIAIAVFAALGFVAWRQDERELDRRAREIVSRKE